MRMKEPEQLFITNPLVYSSLKKYIWFKEDREQKEGALSLFCRFLIMEIYVDGFATDESAYIGKEAFHKPIVDIGALDIEEAVVFSAKEYEEGLYDICQTATVLNPMVNKERMVIFGAGKYGLEVHEQLTRRGMGEGLHCFIDSDTTKCSDGSSKAGLPVYGIDILSKLSEDTSVIEASAKYKEMDILLQRKQYRQRRFFYEETIGKYLKYVYSSDENLPIIVQYIYNMKVFFGTKKIYFYGEQTERNLKTAKCIQLLDFNFHGFVYDETDKKEHTEYSVKLIEDLLYEDDYFIILENDKVKINKMHDLGLKKNIDFNIMPQLSFCNYILESMLDINLGYTYKENSRYPGIAIYGEEKPGDFKIAVLGGSTTDDIYDKRNWARILYEKWPNDAVTVYNGGTCGYTSTQELIKLERDILPLNPNLIIVYDGFNDLCEDPGHPFAIPYLKQMFDLIVRNIHEEGTGHVGNDMDISAVNIGVDTGENYFENWLSKLKCMSAVSQTKDIAFMAFAQPTRYNMLNRKGIDEWVLSSSVFWVENCAEPFRLFREMIENRKIEEDYTYIYNLTGIFDDRPDVYMDSCHLFEKGNEIIADRILHVIDEKGIAGL